MRLAREIHDGLGHHLTVLSIQLQAAEKLTERNPQAAQQLAKCIHAAVQGLLVNPEIGRSGRVPDTRELVVGHTRDEQRLFTVIGGLLGEVGEEQASTALATLAPGPDGERRYREAFPAAGPEEE